MKLTPEERVRVAKDVLLRLKKKRYIAKSGVYYQPTDGPRFHTEDWQGNAQDTLKAVKSCQVCAVGAVFAAAVERYGGKTNNGQCVFGDITELAQTFFPKRQLRQMECRFEGWGCRNDAFAVLTPRTRMRRIMQNIIDNKGDFKPEELTK